MGNYFDGLSEDDYFERRPMSLTLYVQSRRLWFNYRGLSFEFIQEEVTMHIRAYLVISLKDLVIELLSVSNKVIFIQDLAAIYSLDSYTTSTMSNGNRLSSSTYRSASKST